MVISLGMIGTSPENGHPYSFSAILNGFDAAALEAAGWIGILRNLQKHRPDDLRLADVQVTHAWTQDPEETNRLCRAARISRACRNVKDLLGAVDAVVIARDDAESHWTLAQPLLEAGMPVFIDKPLTLNSEELIAFRPYLLSGKLFSASATRFATELDLLSAQWASLQPLRLVRGTIVKGWNQYGIHLLEALMPYLPMKGAVVTAQKAAHESVALSLTDGTLVQIDAMGDVPFVFSLEFFGKGGTFKADLLDNISMFRRLLERFVTSVRTGQPAIDPQETLTLMQLLREGRDALDQRPSATPIHEIAIS